MKDGDAGPEQRVEVLSIADAVTIAVLGAELAAEQVHAEYAEDEDEEEEEREERGHVVERLEHDEELATQRGHEAHQLEYAQQAERAQHRHAARVGRHLVANRLLEYFIHAITKTKSNKHEKRKTMILFYDHYWK